MKFDTEFLVKNKIRQKNMSFRKINDILDYNGESCIIVKTLNPDFTMLLGNVEMIITQTGSKISHLAIVSREQEKIVLKTKEKIFEQLYDSGVIKVNERDDVVEIETS